MQRWCKGEIEISEEAHDGWTKGPVPREALSKPRPCVILFGAGLNVNSRFTDLSEREGYEYTRMQKFNTNGIEDQWEQAPPKEGGGGGESVGQSKSV